MLIRNVQVAHNFFHHSFIKFCICLGNPNCNRAGIPSALFAGLTTLRKNEYGSLLSCSSLSYICRKRTSLLTVRQTSWCSLFRLFQSLWQSEPCSFVAKVVQLWDHWLIITMVWKLFKQSPTESSAGWYILFLVRCLIWSSSGLFIRAFIFCYIY